MSEKKELRSLVKSKLTKMNTEEYKSKSDKIKQYLCSTTLWKESNTIAITISKGNEVNTYKIIERAWKEGKTTVVPKTFPETNEMVFFQINHFNELESTYFQLKEPNVHVCLPYERDRIDLIIVPGVAFDTSGNRLGYGGGYYDRYLVNYKGNTCALAFEQQIIDGIPLEPFDIPVQMIVTEARVYIC